MSRILKVGNHYLNLDAVAVVEVSPPARATLSFVGSPDDPLDLRYENAVALRAWLDRVALDVMALDGPGEAPAANPAADLMAEVQAALKAPGGPLPKLEAVRAAVARAKRDGRERQDE